MYAAKDITVEERAGGALWITIERAQKHNALARHVLVGLAQVVSAAASQPGVRCIVLTGAGERYFAADGDLVDLSGVRDREATLAMSEHSGVPVIAEGGFAADLPRGGTSSSRSCSVRSRATMHWRTSKCSGPCCR